MADITTNSTYKILAVDDNPHNIQLLGEILSKENYEFSAALNGNHALTNLEIYTPDLILLDIMMPELDGFATCQKIKENPTISDIPIIFLTAKNQAEDIVRGFELGAVDYITKPFNKVELIARIKTHIHLKDQKEKVSKMSQDKEALIHILCHDLINPIGSVFNLLSLVDDGVLNIKDGNSLHIMKNSLQHCMNIMQMVREQRVLLSGKYKLLQEGISLKTSVLESLSIMNSKLQAKNIKIEVAIDQSIVVYVEKTSFINTILNNLFSNSIKFSYPNGKLKVYSHSIETVGLLFLVFDFFGFVWPKDTKKNFFYASKNTTRLGTEQEIG
ncbi:MAG: response regulator, partial [Spirochaetota bacterium]